MTCHIVFATDQGGDNEEASPEDATAVQAEGEESVPTEVDPSTVEVDVTNDE
jgi:hypothetical protein